MNLENQIKKVDGMVSGFEKELSKDGAISDAPNALQNRMQDLQVSRTELYGCVPQLQDTWRLISEYPT